MLTHGRGAWAVGDLLALLLLLAAIGAQVGLPARGVPPRHVPDHDGEFRFADPPCRPAGEPPPSRGRVRIAYLGVGGVLIRWQGEGILAAPFFSHYGLTAPLLGRIDWRHEAIDRGMAGLPLQRVRTVLVGHSHYDHIGDLPPVVERWVPEASVYVNPSGAAMLAPYAARGMRVRAVDADPAEWIRPRAENGGPLPYRFLPVPSEHAPHFPGIRYAHGLVQRPWETTWEGRRLRDFVDGRPLAFLIELLDPETGEVAFRIHYQDSASPPPMGMPPVGTVPPSGVDLAILCVPSAHLVAGYPERLLERARPGHTMAIHWESFFRDPSAPLRAVASLTSERLAGFLDTVAAASDARRAGSGPRCGCGPCGPALSLPLPGDWLVF